MKSLARSSRLALRFLNSRLATGSVLVPKLALVESASPAKALTVCIAVL